MATNQGSHIESSGRVNVLGVSVSTRSLRATAAQIVTWASQPPPPEGPRYVCATSVHGVIEGVRDPEFARILNRAAVVTPDGMPLVWFGRLSGASHMERVYGPALMKTVCELSVQSGATHFLYGGVAGVAEKLAARLGELFPGIKVVGTYTPPFRLLNGAELDDVAVRINDSKAEIVWVGLGTPKQERWIDSIRQRLRARVVLTVGAAFDFHTGRVRQAPAWMQRNGLEWLFRLFTEPRRLWRRYLYNNPLFLLLATLQILGLRQFGPRPEPRTR